MSDKSIIYAGITENMIEFLGFNYNRAESKAIVLGSDIYAFPSNLVMKWRKMSSINQAARGCVNIEYEDARALSRVGKLPPVTDIPLADQIKFERTARNNVLLQSYPTFNIQYIHFFCNKRTATLAFIKGISPEFENRFERICSELENNTYSQTFVTPFLDLIYNEKIEKFVDDMFDNLTDPMLNVLSQLVGQDDEVVKRTLEQAKSISKLRLFNSPEDEKEYGVEEIIVSTLKYLVARIVTNTPITDNDYNNTDWSLRKDIRKNSVSPEVCAKVIRYTKKCEVLDLIKEKDIKGQVKTYKQIATETKTSPALVSQVKGFYEANNDITHDDLWERKRGPKRDPFTIIPSDVYAKFVNDVQNHSPLEFGIKCYSWSGEAVYLYFQQLGFDLKLSYVYDFCRKLGITSKFASRKNPKENQLDIDDYLSSRYPKECEKSIINNVVMLHIDEMHLIIDHHFQGYSLANTPTSMAYDTSLKHSMCSLVNVVGQSCDGQFNFSRSFLVTGSVDSKAFTECLNKIKLEFRGVKFCIVMDNAPIHTSYETLAWFLKNKNRFSYLYLPRYCPRLNVVEFFNNMFREYLKKNALMTQEEVYNKAKELCDKFNSGSEEVQKLIESLFLKEECSYIKTTYEEVFKKLKENIAARVG